MDPGPASPNQEGPKEPPPSLPEGWLAQWDSKSQKYYFVQRATGHSQWDIPTQPALSVPTPEPTPQAQSPFQKPEAEPYEGADRGLLGDLATNALSGGKHSQKPQSGLETLASSFLGGQHHGGSTQSGSGGSGGIAGQLLGGLLGGSGKPQEQASQNSGSGYSSSTSGSHHSGGLSGAAASLFGGSHNTSGQNNYGYTPSGHTSSGSYTGSAPPATYTPSGQSTNQYNQSHHSQQQVQQPPFAPTGYSGNQHHAMTGQSSAQPPNQWGHDSSTPHAEQAPYGQQQYGQYGISSQSYNQPSSGSQHQQPQHQNLPYQGGQYPHYPPPPPSQTQGQYGDFPPPPPPPSQVQSFSTSSSQGGSQNLYSSPPPLPLDTRPGNHGTVPGQAPQYSAHSYPGQQNFGQAPQAQTQGFSAPPQHGGYNQGGSQYTAYGAPPPPAWR